MKDEEVFDMILQNYWRWLGGRECASITRLRDTGGSWFDLSTTVATSTWDLVTGIGAQIGIGSGLSPIAFSDYNVQGQVNTISVLSVTSSIISNTQGIQRVFTITGRNTDSTETTITRVGIIKDVGGNTKMLLAELDLEEPITVGAGRDFNITLSWNEL